MELNLFKLKLSLIVYVILNSLILIRCENVDLNLNFFSIDVNIVKVIGEDLLKNEEKIEGDCAGDILYAMQSLPSLWAIQLFDSSGKLPPGITEGNINSFGQFDMCIGINHVNNENNRNIQGKYCLAKVSFGSILGEKYLAEKIERFSRHSAIMSKSPGVNLDILKGIHLNMAVCIPTSCNGSNIQNLIANSGINSSIIISDNECSTSDGIPLSAADWCAISLLIIFGLLIFISTTYDFYTYCMEKEPHRYQNLMVSFSLKTNTERLFKINNSSASLKCIHGIRTLSMFWVILGHRYFATLANPTWSFSDLLKWVGEYRSMIVVGGTVSVDTFLLLSGLLLTYVFMKQMEKAKSFNVIMFYVHRHLRLTPAFAAIILFQATLYRHMGNGPIYHSMLDQSIVSCQKNWWPSLLYVQNYVRSNDMCIGQSWYLAVDMQLYYLSPLILYPLYKSMKFGLINLSVWILAFMTTLLTIVYTHDWSAAAVPLIPGSEDKVHKYYIATHTRAVPWLIGIAVGYAIYNTTKKNIRINRYLVAFLWTSSFIIMGAVVFGLKGLQDPTHVPNKLEDGTFDSFHRISWVLAVSWTIFACIHGYGGPINWFLSLSIWEILGRLSYSMYLVHLSIQFWQASMLRVVPNFSQVQMIYNYFGDLFFTVSIAYCITMMFESPILVLEKIIFPAKKPENIEKKDLISRDIQE